VNERKVLGQLAAEKKKLEKELDALREEYKMSVERANSLKNTFGRKIHDILVNSNQNKYLFIKGEKWYPNWPKKDEAVLEKHYKGVCPDESEAKNFERIILEFHDKIKPKDPVRDRLGWSMPFFML
jgi:hypothetical protein